jgi:hypothetical protein
VSLPIVRDSQAIFQGLFNRVMCAVLMIAGTSIDGQVQATNRINHQSSISHRKIMYISGLFLVMAHMKDKNRA